MSTALDGNRYSSKGLSEIHPSDIIHQCAIILTMNTDCENILLIGESAERYFDFIQNLIKLNELFNKDETIEQ